MKINVIRFGYLLLATFTMGSCNADQTPKTGSSLEKSSSSVISTGVCHLRDFGALGDGVTDDTAALLKAFAAIQKGGVLIFGKGVFLVSGMHQFEGYENCVFDASGAVIKNKEQGGFFWFIKSKHITWQGGVLNYVNAPEKESDILRQHPFYFLSSTYVRIENVHVEFSSFMGIVINDCRYVWVVNNQVSNAQRDGIHFVHTQDFFCTGNYVENTGDDAICAHWYGSIDARRTERGVISGNTVYNCIQGISLTNTSDMIVSNNHVQKTVLAACQVTTNDRNNNGPQDGEIRRIKVIGNTFSESGEDLNILGREIKNQGQISTGRAAIMVCYIDHKDGWSKDGESFFSTQDYDCSRFSDNSIVLKGDFAERGVPGRSVKLVSNQGDALVGKITKAYFAKNQTEVWLEFQDEKKLGAGDYKLSFSKILTDIDIIDNEIYSCAVNGLHANTVYRLRVLGNRFFNCNRSNTQYRNNWIVEQGAKKLHKQPINFTAADGICKDNMIK
jgi:parallel beta-helix repeat protein